MIAPDARQAAALKKLAVAKPTDILSAQDLLDAGMRYFTANDVAAITVKRTLELLVEHYDQSIDEKRTGTWIPLFSWDGKQYVREPRAVADPDLGHQIRIPRAKGARKPEDFYYGRAVQEVLGAKPQLTIRYGNNSTADITGGELLGVQVSTLGMLAPQSKTDMIRQESLRRLFQRTVLPENVALDVLVMLLSGKDGLFHGPPGSGKSQLAKDILTMHPAERYIVDGCPQGCHPYSLTDAEVAKTTEACPSCKDYYMQLSAGDRNASRERTDGPFFSAGHFTLQDPKVVQVRRVPMGRGHGIEKLSGSENIRSQSLTGFKPFNLADLKANDSTPIGAILGVLARANNGYIVVDEIDKILKNAGDPLLEALQDNEITLPGVRYTLPSNTLFIGTANNAGVLSGPINDRLVYVHVPRPSPNDMDSRRAIFEASFYGIRNHPDSLDVGDVYLAHRTPLERVPMTIVDENAVLRLFANFETEGNTIDKDVPEIMASQRAINDAMYAIRAYNLAMNILNPSRPNEVTTDDIEWGIAFALRSRVNLSSPDRAKSLQDKLVAHVRDKIPGIIVEESKTFNCAVKRELNIMDREIPGILKNFESEVVDYRKDVTKAAEVFGLLKARYERAERAGTSWEADTDALKLVARYPFMGYLAHHQPVFFGLKPDRAQSLIATYIAHKAI